MDDENANAAEGRAPEVEDLVGLCRRLNELGAKYLVVGGFAIIQAGFPRATMDIDLLVESYHLLKLNRHLSFPRSV